MTALVTANLSLLSSAPNGIKKLRQLILTLAVQGRLVPQDQSEQPAAEFLIRIAAHKADSAARSRSRRPPEVPEPIEIAAAPYLPPGWIWTTFGNATVCRDGDRIPVSRVDREQRKKLYDYYGASGVIDKIDGYLFDKPLLLIGEDGANLVNRSSPIAFIARGQYWVNNHAHVIDAATEGLLNYLELYINAIDLKPYVTGTAQPKMNQAKLNSIPLALPPEAEQLRIVAKVDELMALCDRLESEQANAEAAHAKLVETLLASLTQARDAADFRARWQQLAEHFHTLFTTEASVDALKLAICQLAVSGRLVQPEAGRGVITELVAQLADHWKNRSPRRLALAAVSADEQRFVLPSSWAWLHFGFLAETRLGKMLDAAKNKGELKPYLRNTNVQWDRFELNDLKELRLEASQLEEYAVNVGDLMICEGGEPGRCAVWRDESREIYFQKAIHRARPLGGISADYLQICLRVDAASGVLSRLFTGATIKHLTGEKLERYSVPVPPPEEQRRIVARVSELLDLCDQLKTSLGEAHQHHDHLASALVEQTIA